MIERRKDSIIIEAQNLPVWVETHTLTETQYVSDLTLFQKRLCVNLIAISCAFGFDIHVYAWVVAIYSAVHVSSIR